jgi:hypothetical protein
MDNTPAFPLHNHGTQTLGMHFTGMTLRDYFAAKAMQAIIGRNDNRFTTTLEFVGGKSYQYADAMMKERSE